MSEFANRGLSRLSRHAPLLSGLVMCVLPIATFTRGESALCAAMALFWGIADGFIRLWSSCSARSFVAEPEGLRIGARLAARVVPWANVLAIEAWHHFNRVDVVAVHYRHAGRMEIDTCFDRYAEGDVRAFVHGCAERVGVDAPRWTIERAGLSERAVYLPLLRRFVQNVAVATLIGYVLGVFVPGLLLGLLAACVSSCLAASRSSLRTTMFVQRDGQWRSPGIDTAGAPSRTIPRALELWVNALAERA